MVHKTIKVNELGRTKKVIKHIVMWRIKDKDQEAMKKIKTDLEGLKGKIEEIKAIEVGIDFNGSDAAYDLVLYSEFDNKEGLVTYQSHPEHVKVGQFIKSVTVSRTVVDYEV